MKIFIAGPRAVLKLDKEAEARIDNILGKNMKYLLVML